MGGSELQLCLLFGQVAQRTEQNLRLSVAHGGFAFDGSCFPRSASSTGPGAGTAGNVHWLGRPDLSCPASLEHQGLHSLCLLLLRAASFRALFSLSAFAYSPNRLVPGMMGSF